MKRSTCVAPARENDRRPVPAWLTAGRAYTVALYISLAICIWHTVSLPLLVTFDGYWYARLAEILGTARFAGEWDYLRTPVFPILLKVAFWIFGRHAPTVAALQAGFAFGGIWLLGATLKRWGRIAEAAFLMPFLSFCPTLVTYQHALLTEIGTFFFLAALIYVFAAPVRNPWRRAVELACVIALGFYHRSTVLYLAPVVACLYAIQLWSGRDGGKRSLFRMAPALAVALLPFLLAYPWQRNPRVSARTGQSVLLYGLVKQAVFPPDDPILGPAAPLYRAAVQQSLVGARLPLTGVLDQLVYPPLDGLSSYGPQAGGIFLREIRAHPRAYLAGVGRSLLLYAGIAYPATDNGAFQASIMDRGESAIAPPTPGFPPLNTELAQKTGVSIAARALRLASPFYAILLFLASFATLILCVAGLRRGDAVQCAFSATPLAYVLLNALVLNSQDRMAVPVYPFVFANLALLPRFLRRKPALATGEDPAFLQRLDRRALPALAALIAILAGCHTVYVARSAMIPSSDEAQYMSGVLGIGRAIQSLSPWAVIQSYRSALGFKPPLVCLPASFLYPLVGDVILASSLSLILVFLALGFAAYSLFRNVYRPVFAAFAAALLVASPIVTGLTHRFYVEGPLLLLCIVYSDLLIRYRFDRMRSAVLLGIVAGAGLLMKALFAPIVFLPTLFIAWVSYRDGAAAHGRLASLGRLAGRLAVCGILAIGIAATWYWAPTHMGWTFELARGNAHGFGGVNYAVRNFLVNASSGPYFFTFLLALPGLAYLGHRIARGEAAARESQAWAVIVLGALFIPAVNAVGSSNAVRYLAVLTPPVSALAVLTAQTWVRGSRRLVAALGALVFCSTALAFHNSFDILPFHWRVGYVRLLDSRYPLNPPDWFDDNHPLDRRDFRVAEAEARVARDAAERHPPGSPSQTGLLVHGLLINHDYLNLLAEIRRHPMLFNPFYLTEVYGDRAPEYALTCVGCGEPYPGVHWFNPFADFVTQTRAGRTPYEEIFRIQSPAGCELLGFRRRKTAPKQATLKGLEFLVGQPPNFVDRVDSLSSGSAIPRVSRKWPLHIAGWAVDGPASSPAGGVYLDIEGEIYQARYGVARPDVAAVLANPAYSNSGFDADIPIDRLEPGRHSVAILVLNAAKTGYYRVRAVEILVE